jgi:hypothetical protein
MLGHLIVLAEHFEKQNNGNVALTIDKNNINTSKLRNDLEHSYREYRELLHKTLLI